MNNKIKLNVLGLSDNGGQSGAYLVILGTEDGLRKLPIIVGISEAQSILIAHEGITPPRPLTHDLCVAMLKTFDIALKEAYINKWEGGVFFSELIFVKKDGSEVHVDSRTSDAIAIALRINCDIYTTETIMETCSVSMDDEDEDEDDEEEDDDWDEEDDEEDLFSIYENKDNEPRHKRPIWSYDLDELKANLAEAIKQENYEYAQMYRDELLRREESGEV